LFSRAKLEGTKVGHILPGLSIRWISISEIILFLSGVARKAASLVSYGVKAT